MVSPDDDLIIPNVIQKPKFKMTLEERALESLYADGEVILVNFGQFIKNKSKLMRLVQEGEDVITKINFYRENPG